MECFKTSLSEQGQGTCIQHLGNACFASGLHRFQHPELIKPEPSISWQVGPDMFTCKRKVYEVNFWFSFGLCRLCGALQWCVWGLCLFVCSNGEVAFSRYTLTFLTVLPRLPSAWQERERHMGWRIPLRTPLWSFSAAYFPQMEWLWEKPFNFLSLSQP